MAEKERLESGEPETKSFGSFRDVQLKAVNAKTAKVRLVREEESYPTRRVVTVGNRQMYWRPSDEERREPSRTTKTKT